MVDAEYWRGLAVGFNRPICQSLFGRLWHVPVSLGSDIWDATKRMRSPAPPKSVATIDQKEQRTGFKVTTHVLLGIRLSMRKSLEAGYGERNNKSEGEKKEMRLKTAPSIEPVDVTGSTIGRPGKEVNMLQTGLWLEVCEDLSPGVEPFKPSSFFKIRTTKKGDPKWIEH